MLLSRLSLFTFLLPFSPTRCLGYETCDQDLPLDLGVPIHSPSTTNSTCPIIRTVNFGYATYETDLSLDVGVSSFLGIRYAAPPTGQLRFSAPQRPARMAGVQSAMKQPPQCLQDSTYSFGISTENPFNLSPATENRQVVAPVNAEAPPKGLREYGFEKGGSEDCLFLNVHLPSSFDPSSATGLSVIVYIHGGGYMVGNIAMFPGETLVRDSGYRVIVVQMQYRLGVFGFLAGEEVKRSGALNAGLLDQELALQWVQDHIAKFKGDPKKVTIWGGSAGAGSVLQHVLAHDGTAFGRYFRAAILDSVFLPPQYRYDEPVPEVERHPIFSAIYDMMVASVGCTTSRDTLSCLRSTDAHALLGASMHIFGSNFMGLYTFVPVIDGELVVERPLAALKNNKTNTVYPFTFTLDTLLVINASHEGDAFVDPSKLTAHNFTLARYIANVFPRMDEDRIRQAVELYSSFEFSESGVATQAAAVMGDSILVCPGYAALKAFPSTAWKAEFAVPPSWHSGALTYQFPRMTVPVRPAFQNAVFQCAYQQIFFATALSQDPKAHYLAREENIIPAWPMWKESRKLEMVFNHTEDEPERARPVVKTARTDESLMRRCAFWESVAGVSAQ